MEGQAQSVPEASPPPGTGKRLLSKDEEEVLALYDKLEALKLELAIAREVASRKERGSSTSDADPNALKKAQKDLLEKRASYVLRKQVIESVMMAAPIIKSVHSNSHTSPIERDLLPLIEKRDDISITMAKQATDIQAVSSKLAEVRAKTLAVSRRNVELTSQLLELAKAEEARKNDPSSYTPEEQAEIEALQHEVRASKKKWKVVKSTASAIIVGSGVDWASDRELRDIVLDPE